MFCPISRKVAYDTEQIALEALFQHHIRQHHPTGRGPINIYLCDHCSAWHFTSKGEMHPEIKSEEGQRRIAKEREGTYWERRLR
ncbi:MAG: hypothetical protein ACJAZM_001048 [Cyclobacteriaceae bacterium]|jgi:hypothetical protein